MKPTSSSPSDHNGKTERAPKITTPKTDADELAHAPARAAQLIHGIVATRVSRPRVARPPPGDEVAVVVGRAARHGDIVRISGSEDAKRLAGLRRPPIEDRKAHLGGRALAPVLFLVARVVPRALGLDLVPG